MNEELKTRIQNDKEILSVLPQNNVRNAGKYAEKIRELLSSYKKDKKTVFDFIVQKNKSLSNYRLDENISSFENEKNAILDDYKFVSSISSPYELLELDRVIYNLHKFYNNNLDSVNDNINSALDIFNTVGIALAVKDFNFSPNVQNYMETFITEKCNGDYNSLKVKECFEKIYWKSPNVIKHIMLNFKHLYYQKEKEFEKYVSNKKVEILAKYENSIENLENKFIEAFYGYENLVNASSYLLLQKFTSKELLTKDFEEVKIEKLKSDLLNEVKDNPSIFQKLLHSLEEYHEYLDLKYIVDDLSKMYNEKDTYKDLTKNRMKDILTVIKNIEKLNGKIDSYKNGKLNILFKKDHTADIEKTTIEIEDALDSIDESFEEYEMDKFKERILTLNDNSSINDYLRLAISSYVYLLDLHKRNDNKEFNFDELSNNINLFIINPHNSVFRHTSIRELEKIDLVIADKYRLIGMNITSELLDSASLDGLITNVRNISLYNEIINVGLTINQIDFVCKTNEIIEKENATV